MTELKDGNAPGVEASGESTKSEGPPKLGTIGLLTGETARFTRFFLHQMGLQLPGPVKFLTKFSLNIPEARNQVLAEAEGDWVFFMDDDHTFAPDLLMKLLARNVPVVQPLVLSRYAPFGPVIMGPQTGDGKAHWKYALTTTDPTDLKPVHVAGAAGMLIRREVWEKIPPPWFTYGELQPDVLSEDMGFCRKVREAGFPIYCDMENRMGHLNTGEVWPIRLPDGTWKTRVIFGSQAMDIDAAAPKFRLDDASGKAFSLENGEEVPNAYGGSR